MTAKESLQLYGEEFQSVKMARKSSYETYRDTDYFSGRIAALEARNRELERKLAKKAPKSKASNRLGDNQRAIEFD